MFPTNALLPLQTTALTSEEPLEALQNLDPSILSIFEDTSNAEVRLPSPLF